VDQHLNWRWIFYIMTTMGGALTFMSYFFLKETLYRPNERKLPPLSNVGDWLETIKAVNPVSSIIQNVGEYHHIKYACLLKIF
jgi:predicted MFS family arabinose efflux permease